MKSPKIYILIVLVCLAAGIQAQVTPLADQFLLNPFLTNPAIAGTSAKRPLSLSARQQWLGLKGAPSWQSATWHTSFNSGKKRFNPRGFINKGENSFGNIGLGGGLFNVKYGAISQIGIHLDYAYHVYLGKGLLSLGLAPLYQQLVINKSGFIPPDGSIPDPLIDGDAKEVLHFVDFNAGIHYFTDNFFAGLSIVQMFNSSVCFGELSFISKDEYWYNPYMARSFYLYGGLTPELSRNVTLEPMVLLKFNAQTGLGIQASLKATITGNFHFGILYHWRESAGFFAGARIGDYFFRYQFEAPFGKTVLNGYTTNQILVGYMF